MLVYVYTYMRTYRDRSVSYSWLVVRSLSDTSAYYVYFCEVLHVVSEKLVGGTQTEVWACVFSNH